jgi:hypothetical protein
VRLSGAGSQRVPAISRSAMAARSDFFAFSQAGATVPRASFSASMMPALLNAAEVILGCRPEPACHIWRR